MRRGRRKRGVLAALAVLLLAAAAAAALVVVPMLTYDDVAEGSSNGTGDRGRFVDGGPLGNYVAKRFVGRGRTTAETSIANAGDRDVEIVELGDTAPREDVVALEGVRVSPEGVRTGAGSGVRYVAFEPFELAAGEERAVQMRFRMGSCDALEPGRAVTVTSLHVRYRTGIADRGENIELRSPVQFKRDRRCEGSRSARE